MGAEPWEYVVPYEADLEAALSRLREQEFRAGRFRGAEDQPASIEEALEMMDADGTASILDMLRVSDEPDFFAVTPLTPEQCRDYFGSPRPSRAQIESSGGDVFEDIERGHGVCAVVYSDDQPSEWYFAGYSFD